MSLVSGTYHENKVSVVMEMASFSLKIRHAFGDTLLTERSIGAGPPVIIQLSDINQHEPRVGHLCFDKARNLAGKKRYPGRYRLYVPLLPT
jgi:hypothetical protein